MAEQKIVMERELLQANVIVQLVIELSITKFEGKAVAQLKRNKINGHETSAEMAL